MTRALPSTPPRMHTMTNTLFASTITAFALLLTASTDAAAAGSGALENTSVILLCWETTEGGAPARCGSEARFLEVLRREGALLIDAAQAERVRVTLDPKKLATPEGARGVDLLDA